MSKEIQMVEIGGKPDVRRIARARGKIKLRPETIQRVQTGKVEKGDVLRSAELAAIMAVKATPELIPLCHPLSITGVDVDFNVSDKKIEIEVEARSIGKTGVEMEALTGAAVGLLTIWDMVKGYEKDATGQYPITEILEIKVVEKKKENV